MKPKESNLLKLRPPLASSRKPLLYLPCLGILLVIQIIVWQWNRSDTIPKSFWNSRLDLVREKSKIEWKICPDDPSFFCAFLAVPLDYSNRTLMQLHPQAATIAMRLYPATVPSAQRLGTIFTNPGGPGASGHATLLKTGRAESALFQGKFDIVSWDTRGVNMSTPRISCHSTDLRRQLFSLGHQSGGLDFYDMDGPAVNTTLLTASARAELLTELCRDAVGDRVLRSVTTVNVARDLEEMRKAIGEQYLLYWGFSYGTTLGATYAALFPEKVHRMVLDGVVWAPEHYTSLLEHGLSSGDSTTKVFDGFVSSCIAAGPLRCALVNNGTVEPSQLSQRIFNLLAQLRASPLPVAHPDSQAVPSILLPSDLLQSIYATLLRPINWGSLASAIAELENGNGAAIAALSGTGGKAWDFRNLTDVERAEMAGWGDGREMGTDEADMAVACGDVPPFPEVGDATWTHTWLNWRRKLVSNDAFSGPIWFKKMIRCRRWGRIHPPPERYEGQWKMGHDLKPPRHPILFVSNTYDPVTPISSGKRMVELFGHDNARLLENNAYGHCSVSQPSLCIAKAIREYMIDGTLPAEGTVCHPEKGTIFPPNDARLQYEERDELMLQALNDLSEAGLGSSGGW
ncbi:Alpha/Beta hydrolase protein [Mycena albidolilacea]|uniref:Alpha/Beta hydrolase protein n=1 Tax=Mycena albidolilacea TaxID=1033008 RepID=A0AAD7EF77_9AGAR|nr:Alpha/Beta hydrolase protein [Mycena albidolilacea]